LLTVNGSEGAIVHFAVVDGLIRQILHVSSGSPDRHAAHHDGVGDVGHVGGADGQQSALQENLIVFFFQCSTVQFVFLTLGMSTPGFLRSPLKLAPATIPVTAGKNTAKTLKNDSLACPSAS